MQPVIDSLPKPAVARTAAVLRNPATPCIARVTGFDAQRRVLVAIPGVGAVAAARLVKGIRRNELLDANGVGREVLVVFDGAVPARPVIVGLLETEAEESAARIGGPDEHKVEPAATHPENILIEAQGELVLKCGSGSITLRRDGKIVLRGTHLLSRASGPIRIKGGHVEIN